MNKEVNNFEEIMNHRKLTDRELMEQIYELLVGVNMKLDKLGFLKYREMGIEDTNFVYPFKDNIPESIANKKDSLEETLKDTQEFFTELFKDTESK
ncbi:hypothetical protein JMN10_05365 [Capnocytophaga genosp. AHN8471]|jgi:hypothetical protein|uniref:Uncharacterized protein n=1 Tax=Capnocytophaga genosp. AHN8471 TaxID=327574 RepID=A0ABS1YX50_9FLAO|nr:hypothetical protein [Capnocytophaga genosp. AHN8471]MBM0651000.1 hypothetical protein [Capnocytophaga genosp. AHN8471]MBM0661618.1 hypothetical protein [Capnocytophaga genosp. AHN8471]